MRTWMFYLVLMVGTAFSSKVVGDNDRPNILFIYTDDQSYRTVSCYPVSYTHLTLPTTPYV